MTEVSCHTLKEKWPHRVHFGSSLPLLPLEPLPPHPCCHSSDILMLHFSLVAFQSLSTSSFLHCFGPQDIAFGGGEKPGKGAMNLKRGNRKKCTFLLRTFKI